MMNIECDKQMMRYHINIQSKYGKLLLNSFNTVLWDSMHTYARVSHEVKPVQKSFRGEVLNESWQKKNKTAPISKLIKVFSRVNLYYDLWMNKGVNVCVRVMAKSIIFAHSSRTFSYYRSIWFSCSTSVRLLLNALKLLRHKK